MRAVSKQSSMPPPIADNVKTLSLSDLRTEYSRLKSAYDEIKNGYYCHDCDRFLSDKHFYFSSKTKSGVIPTCKECLFKIATQYDEKNKSINETEDSLKKALRKADLPFSKRLYETSINATADELSTKRRSYIFSHYISLVQSLPQYQNKSWQDSDFEYNEINDYTELDKRVVTQETKSFFGFGFEDDEYLFLQDQYNDWTSRHQCDTKTQEEIFKRLCFTQLEILRANKNHAPTKDLDKTFQDYLETANLKPKQNSLEAFSEAQTFGQLIEEWEKTKPIPECDEEFKDVNKIGQYIDVFFKGHLAKSLGIKNGLSNLYNKFISKYTVKKQEYIEDDDDSDSLFDTIFGVEEEE